MLAGNGLTDCECDAMDQCVKRGYVSVRFVPTGVLIALTASGRIRSKLPWGASVKTALEVMERLGHEMVPLARQRGII